ncbi:MAG TPA: PAS domain S-box protein [Blastocatellia bacterium]|nr:PAS domain S-box protein [Blastocatellia bacterium]
MSGLSGSRDIIKTVSNGGTTACAGLASIIGLIMLGENLFNSGFGVDTLLFRDALLAEAAPYQGRMAEVTAIGFILLGGALLSLKAKAGLRQLFSEWFALTTVFTGLAALIGYLYDTQSFYQIVFNRSMPFYTALLLIVLGCGVFLARPKGRLMAVIISKHSGGLMFRRLLPITIILPLALGWIILIEERRGLYDAGFWRALSAVCNVAISVIMIWLIARSLDNADIKRLSADRELRKSLERFRLLVDGVKDYGIFMLDPEGRFVSWNAGAERIVGYTTEEILGRHFTRFYPPEDAESGKGARELEAAIAQGETRDEGWRVRKDGNRFWATITVTALRDAEGRLRGFSKIVRDATARREAELALKRAYESLELKVAERTAELTTANARLKEEIASHEKAEESLRRQTELLESVLENISDGVVVIDREEKFLVFNRAAEEICGRGATETTSAEWPETYGCFLPDGQTPFPSQQLPIVRAICGEQVDNVEVFGRHPGRPDGFWMLVSARPLRQANGELRGGVAVCRDITERKRAEEALRESEAKLKRAQQVGNVGSWEWDIGTGELFWSEQTSRQFGLAPDQAVPSYEAFRKCIHPEDLASFTAHVERTLSEHTPFEMELRLVRPDGAVRTLFARGDASLDNDNQPSRMVGVSLDITERKSMETALNKAHERLRRFVDANIIGIVIATPAGEIMEANDYYLNIAGLTREELENGKNHQRVFTHPDWLPADEPALQELRLLGTCAPYEKECPRPDGRRVPVLIAGAMLAGPEEQIAAFVLDLTERKKIEEELRTIEWLLTGEQLAEDGAGANGLPSSDGQVASTWTSPILKSVGEAMLKDIVGDYIDLLGTSAAIYDRNGDCVIGLFSPVWQRFLGQSSRWLSGKASGYQIPGGDTSRRSELDVAEYSKIFVETGQPIDFDCQNGIRVYAAPIRAGGEVVGSIEFSYGYPSKDSVKLRELAVRYQADGDELLEWSRAYKSRPPFIIELAKKRLQVSARLIGEIVSRHQVEEEVKAIAADLERSNAELQDFASVASHDLQEPLRKIQTFAQELREYGRGLGEEEQGLLRRMQEAADRMRRLISDLLAFSRVTTEARPFIRTDLSEVVQDAVSNLEVRIRETGGKVEVGPLHEIDADPLQMRQLLQNLIGNALKFHRPGEPPIVKVNGGFIISSRNGAEHLPAACYRLTVEDNGIGFDEKYLDRIFTIFQRLHGRQKYEGTGIGLAVCRKVARRHGGEITARSEPGRGSIFIVTIPTQHKHKGDYERTSQPDHGLDGRR